MKVTMPNGYIVEGTSAELNPLLGIAAGPVTPTPPPLPRPVPAPPLPARTIGLPTAVTPKQFQVIELLRKHGALTRNQIVDELAVTTSTVDNRLHKLGARGIVRRSGRQWRLTDEADSTTFTPDKASRGFGGHLDDEDRVPVDATVRVLSTCLYDTIQTMLDYQEPIKAAGIATLMGVPTTTASGRLDGLKERGLVEQYPNHTTWRVVPAAVDYTYYPEGI